MSVPADGHRYYTGQYWNDFETVRRHLDHRTTGDGAVSWYASLATRGLHFSRVLMLNCGNGWVERELQRAGVIDEVVGIDISGDLLAQARAAAGDIGLPAQYVEMDVNSMPLPNGPFDLVVNHAAGHHIAHIDHVFRQVADRLSPDGLFISWDYVGPHRNQYPAAIWEAAWEVNRELPAHLRQTMQYPHLDTMLADDPTEAVHSELVLPTIERHFDVTDLRRLGGAIGYGLLTHNSAIHAGHPEEVEPVLEQIMTADAAFCDAHPEHTLFAYVEARPRNEPHDKATLERWRVEEDDREAAAVRNGGEYGPRTWLAELTYGSEMPQVSLGAAIGERFPAFTRAYNRWVEWFQSVVRSRRTSPPR